MDHPDRECAVIRSHRFDFEGLFRHRRNCGPPIGKRRTRVRWFAPRRKVEPRNRIASDDRPAIGAGRFGHQNIFVLGGFGFDQIAGRGCADFFIRCEQNGDWQRRLHACCGQCLDRLEADKIAAFHVLNTGAVTHIAVALEREFFERADGMHRIHVTRDQDARLAKIGVWKARAHRPAKSHPAGDAVNDGTGHRQIIGRDIHHPVDRRGVERGAFAFDPWAQAVQHVIGVKRKVQGVHGAVSAYFAASGKRRSRTRAIIDAPTGRISVSIWNFGL